jgi:hypothetical protein
MCVSFTASSVAEPGKVALRYAGEFPREQFAKHGVTYKVSDRSKSELYRDALSLLNSGRVELLDHPRLIPQLANLERRTARGRDSIDHPPGAHDDVANAVCGALVNVGAITEYAATVIERFTFFADLLEREPELSPR